MQSPSSFVEADSGIPSGCRFLLFSSPGAEGAGLLSGVLRTQHTGTQHTWSGTGTVPPKFIPRHAADRPRSPFILKHFYVAI